jgi:hypothetical protein
LRHILRRYDHSQNFYKENKFFLNVLLTLLWGQLN